MCHPTSSTPAGPDRTETRRFELMVNTVRRRAWIAGILLWASGAALLALHSTRTAMPDPSRFAMADIWLIGLGCIGCPVLPLRALGTRLTPAVCITASVAAFALALLLTVLIVGGALHPNTLDATLEIILPLAAGIQTANAADGEIRARRREQRARRQARLEVMGEMYTERHTTLATLEQIEQMPEEDLEALVDAVTDLIARRRADTHVLHLPSPANRRRSRQNAHHG